MPGAPNRPPEAAPPPPAPPEDVHAREVLRRLAPARVALSLDLWKGAPSPELLTPFESAEAAFSQGDWREAESRLDALSVKLAEPRWPTLPEPFRQLRVSIPAPQPPQWDPEFSLTAEEKQTRRARRALDTQIALARASVDWAQQKGIEVSDLTSALSEASEQAPRATDLLEVYRRIDPVWEALRARVPAPSRPKPTGRPTPAPPPSPAPESPREER